MYIKNWQRLLLLRIALIFTCFFWLASISLQLLCQLMMKALFCMEWMFNSTAIALFLIAALITFTTAVLSLPLTLSFVVNPFEIVYRR